MGLGVRVQTCRFLAYRFRVKGLGLQLREQSAEFARGFGEMTFPKLEHMPQKGPANPAVLLKRAYLGFRSSFGERRCLGLESNTLVVETFAVTFGSLSKGHPA